MRTTLILVAVILAGPLSAQGRRGGEGPRQVPLEATTEPGIAWFGVLEHALAEARRTGKPILLMSGAPACSGVPGMW